LPETAPTLAGIVTAEHLKQVLLCDSVCRRKVKLALRTPSGAAGVVYSLLLAMTIPCAPDNADFTGQSRAGFICANCRVRAANRGVGGRYKLVLAEFAVPALRKNDVAEHAAFHQTMQQLIECDGAIELFEYTLMKMVARQLRSYSTAGMGRTQ